MKGHLASKGINVAENCIGHSLKRVDPAYHIHRATMTYFRTNPTPYYASYFGHKVHVDQMDHDLIVVAIKDSSLSKQLQLDANLTLDSAMKCV